MDKSLFKFSVRDMCEIAIMCALAIAIDQLLNIKIGANGGSISFSCLPLFIISYRHGWFKGLIASGVVFALITCILDAYGFQFFFFEYFIAFGSIAIGGLFGPMIFKTYNRKGVLAKILAIELVILTVCIFFIIRTLAATADSMIFYKYDLAASLIYNLSYQKMSF